MSNSINPNDGEQIKKSLNEFYKKREGKDLSFDDKPIYNNPKTPEGVENNESEVKTSIPQRPSFEVPSDFQSSNSVETDPDLMVGFEVIDLPSKGYFYPDGMSKVKIEYLTSKDEDILTTPSLIQDGTAMDIILKRKVIAPKIDPDKLLTGDKNAMILFLRSSSYGSDYEVQVTDPRDGTQFKQVVDLTKLGYKYSEKPDTDGLFSIHIPVRDKLIKFKLLTSGEEDSLFKRATEIQEAYGHQHNEYSTMKLKANIVEINGKTNRDYISRFVDAMPLKDIVTIKKEILRVSPNIDMNYEFKAKDGYKFKAKLTLGVDFFFPSL